MNNWELQIQNKATSIFDRTTGKESISSLQKIGSEAQNVHLQKETEDLLHLYPRQKDQLDNQQTAAKYNYQQHYNLPLKQKYYGKPLPLSQNVAQKTHPHYR